LASKEKKKGRETEAAYRIERETWFLETENRKPRRGETPGGSLLGGARKAISPHLRSKALRKKEISSKRGKSKDRRTARTL